MRNVVVFSGAGMSAESGIKTFRDSGGLWESYDVYKVATPEAWLENPKLVLEFYNMRRKQVLEAQPNAAHHAIAELEKSYNVHVITQNIDDLHERAGNSKVLHLHGEILKARSISNPDVLIDVKHDLKLGDCDESGSQLRPHVVWFGESVTEMGSAIKLISKADIVLIVGTSLNVYPAAGLISAAKPDVLCYLIDPAEVNMPNLKNLEVIKSGATEGVTKVVDHLLAKIEAI
ncbi:MAG: NAD-dependent deacylase [Salibacteraceae bacterium]